MFSHVYGFAQQYVRSLIYFQQPAVKTDVVEAIYLWQRMLEWQQIAQDLLETTLHINSKLLKIEQLKKKGYMEEILKKCKNREMCSKQARVCRRKNCSS